MHLLLAAPCCAVVVGEQLDGGCAKDEPSSSRSSSNDERQAASSGAWQRPGRPQRLGRLGIVAIGIAPLAGIEQPESAQGARDVLVRLGERRRAARARRRGRGAQDSRQCVDALPLASVPRAFGVVAARQARPAVSFSIVEATAASTCGQLRWAVAAAQAAPLAQRRRHASLRLSSSLAAAMLMAAVTAARAL